MSNLCRCANAGTRWIRPVVLRLLRPVFAVVVCFGVVFCWTQRVADARTSPGAGPAIQRHAAALSHRDMCRRLQAVDGLGRIRSPAVVPLLAKALRDNSRFVSKAAFERRKYARPRVRRSRKSGSGHGVAKGFQKRERKPSSTS